jgi:uncharacterized protein (DUF885 family)
MKAKIRRTCVVLAFFFASPMWGDDPQLSQEVYSLADEYYETWRQHFPDIADVYGIPVDHHDRLFDNSPAGRESWRAVEDRLFVRLQEIDSEAMTGTSAWALYALLEEHLEMSIGLRVCRFELWEINHLEGWHRDVLRLAATQPVGTAKLRRQGLRRWRTFPTFVEGEIANLRSGLAAGYSAPRSVVRRVIDQLDRLREAPVEQLPFFSAAQRDGDEVFAAALRRLVVGEILPALKAYRDFLSQEYLPAARQSLSVLANPDGRKCYEASLRQYTSLKRSPEAVYELGRRTVLSDHKRIVELGEEIYGTTDFVEILRRVHEDRDDYFESLDEMLSFVRASVLRAKASMSEYFADLPVKDVVVELYPDHEKIGQWRYESTPPGEPGIFRITGMDPTGIRKGRAEATTLHEAYPGHHLQIALVQEDLHPFVMLVENAGYTEGWARYAEFLAEEIGLYETRTAPIARRIWQGAGMVVDPGIHAMGWTRQQAVDFILAAGRHTPLEVEGLLDRIAVLPGQLTSYSIGALEILSLRREAEERLGHRFDIKAFHSCVLSHTIPLRSLRLKVEAWIEAELRPTGR